MWCVMPTGAEASREAAARELRDRLEAIRCAATLITRYTGRSQDRELARAILEQLEFTELAAVRSGSYPLPAPRSLYTDSGNTPVCSY